MPYYVTLTQARKDFFNLAEKARVPGHYVRISLRGDGSNVVLMSEDEWEGWKETLEIMSDPVLRRQLDQTMKEMKKGTLKTIPLEKAFKQLGW